MYDISKLLNLYTALVHKYWSNTHELCQSLWGPQIALPNADCNIGESNQSWLEAKFDAVWNIVSLKTLPYIVSTVYSI